LASQIEVPAAAVVEATPTASELAYAAEEVEAQPKAEAEPVAAQLQLELLPEETPTEPVKRNG
jgi:hypothetical protein